MNVFLREMKANLKSLIIWSVSIFLMIVMGMVKFQGYQTSGQSITNVIADMPGSLKVILGFGSLDVSKLSGFYAMLFLYILLMTTIHAAMLGAGIISKEERDKTTEFLMLKPVSRSSIITSKLMAALLNIILVNIVTLISSIVVVKGYSNGESLTSEIVKLMVSMLFLQLIFMSIGSGLAAMRRDSKASPSLAAGVLMLTYIVAKAIDINSSLDILKYLTPFKYFEVEDVLFGKGFDPVFIILSIVITAALTASTYVFYNKRDLTI